MSKTVTKGRKAAVTKAQAPKAKPNADLIKLAKPVESGGDYTFVQAHGGQHLTIPNTRFVGDIAKAAQPGQSYSALEALWAKANVAKLARGVEARQAPHAAKAVADTATKARSAKAAPKPAAKQEAKKAERKAKAEVSKGADRPYKVALKPKDIAAREGTWRHAMLHCIVANKTTQAARDCLKKNREFGSRAIDFGWAAKQGYISF